MSTSILLSGLMLVACASGNDGSRGSSSESATSSIQSSTNSSKSDSSSSDSNSSSSSTTSSSATSSSSTSVSASTSSSSTNPSSSSISSSASSSSSSSSSVIPAVTKALTFKSDANHADTTLVFSTTQDFSAPTTTGEVGKTIYAKATLSDLDEEGCASVDLVSNIDDLEIIVTNSTSHIWRFEMPNSDVEFSIQYNGNHYNLTLKNDSNHPDTTLTFYSSSELASSSIITQGEYGTYVYAKASLSNDDESSYDIDLLSDDDDLEIISANSLTHLWRFKMPNKDVEVSVSYDGKYFDLNFMAETQHPDTKVKFYSSSLLSASSEITEAQYGSTVYVKASLSESDKKAYTLRPFCAVVTLSTVSENVWSFTMPSDNVYLYLNYTEKLGDVAGSYISGSDYLVLNKDGTGSFNDASFTYTYDSDTREGRISSIADEGDNNTFTYNMISKEITLTIKDPSGKIYDRLEMTREVTTFFGKYSFSFKDQYGNEASGEFELKARRRVTDDNGSTYSTYTYDSDTKTITFQLDRFTGYTFTLTCSNSGEITGGSINNADFGSSYQLTLSEL